MTPFSVHTTPRYERPSHKLLKGHPELRALQDRARVILQADPVNRSRVHPIRTLEGVPPGQGQWRLSLGRFRSRYDIFGHQVWLFYCGLRREDSY